MSAGARVAAFVALLAAVFAGAVLLGGALDPDGGGGDGGHGAATVAAEGAGAGHGAAAPGADHGDRHAGDDAPAAAGDVGDEVAAGVASAHHGLRLVAERKRFAAGRPASLRFRILDAEGGTVRAFDVEQSKRMHVIVVRRDLRRYQHLHPSQSGDGAWTTRLTLPDAGVYRAFADFRHDGEQHTLGVDLFVPGDFDPLELPAPASTARVDGYEVALREQPGGELSFAVSRDGRPVSDLQSYLAARGHLVILREGDLAYLHVHPLDGPPGRIAFDSVATEPATYRMFLQFRHRDRVHTAAFTSIVKP
jgi:hypothetical protein